MQLKDESLCLPPQEPFTTRLDCTPGLHAEIDGCGRRDVSAEDRSSRPKIIH